MKEYTYDTLISEGYEIKNGKITDVTLNMKDHGCLTLILTLEGWGWGVGYGGYCLGKGYLGAKSDYFHGSDAGIEAIMRIMDTVGVDALEDLKGCYVRVATKGWGSTVSIIGNIIKDKWFDYKSFFDDKDEQKSDAAVN